MTSPSYHPNVRLAQVGEVTTVTLDKPETKNACSGDMWVALGATFRDVAYSGTRAIILTGAGGVFSSGGMRLQLGVALTLSIAAGSVAGVILGGKTGVKPGLEAGSRFDAAMLAPGESATAQVAAQSDPTPEMARMLDEVRGLRAQIEQLRHGVETARTADRARAQETARDASLEAREQALDQTTATLAAKLSEIDSRLARLERSGADATPVGSIAKPARAGHAVKARAREVR